MKIAFIVRDFPEISETFILNQIKGLIDRGHEVRIYSIHRSNPDKEHDIVEDYELRGNTIFFDPPLSYTEALRETPRQLINLLESDKSMISLLGLFKEWKFAPRKISALEKFTKNNEVFDVIHFHFGTTAKQFMHLRNHTEARIITSFYGYDVSSFPKKSDFDGYDEVFENSAKLTALSRDMSSKLQELGCAGDKIVKVPLCIDTEKFEPRKTGYDKPRILTVARFTEKKGLEYAVEALSKVEKDFEYYLVGDGELREEIEEKVEEEGIKDQVTFHGWMTNKEVKEKMQQSDIFLLPSVTASDGDEEGTPTVLLEAQATGLPIVSTYHAGIPEIVEDGETGLLSEERDVENLSESLIRLIDNPGLREELGKAGRKYIDNNHSIEEVTGILESIYRI